jgi:hypothetical protein
MEHPKHEELLSLLEGTEPDGTDKTLQQHVDTCPQCAAEIAGWRRTVRRLEGYAWPTPQESRTVFTTTMLKWAAAAVFILGIGFGFGRLSQPSGERLRQIIATQVKQQVQHELKADLLAALAKSASKTPDAFGQQLRRELTTALNYELTAAEKQRLVQDTAQVVQRKEDESHRIMFALLNRVRQEHESDYLSLRHDLETAASVADSDLQRSQQQLNQLAATLLAKNQ